MNAPRHPRAFLTALTALFAATTLVACGPQNGEAIAAVGAASASEAQAAHVAPAPAPATARAPVRVAEARPVAARPAPSAHDGEVMAIDPIRTRPQGSGAGAVVGGVLGAVVGNQIGAGTGRSIATVLGGVGGAVAGNNVERNYKEAVVGYRVRVQMDNGDSHTYEEKQLDGLRVGDRVRVEAGHLRRS